MGEDTGCPYVEDDEVAARYLRGRLDEAAADAFESHYFACERCWSEVQGGLEVGSALAAGDRSRAEATGRSARRGGWVVAAAALLATSVAMLSLVRTPEPAWRGPVASFSLSVTDTGASFLVAWPNQEAGVYQVDVTDAEGTVTFTRRVASARIEIRKTDLAEGAKAPLYVRVQALEGPGLGIAASAIRRLDGGTR